MKFGVRHSVLFMRKAKELCPWLFTFILIFLMTTVSALLARGGPDWWIIDFVSGSNVLWGDDAYRYYLSTLAFRDIDIYFFSFTLPLAVFLDGVFLEVLGDQFLVRIAKGFFLAAAGGMMAAALARTAGVVCSVIAVLLVFCFPLNVLVSISYFGESWFLIFSSVFLYGVISRRLWISAFCVSLLPFFRIEGVFFVASFFFMCVAAMRYRLAFLPLIPGTIYTLLIISFGPGLETYISWRSPMNEVYSGAEVWYQFQGVILWSSINTPLLLLAFVGFLLNRDLRYYIIPLLGVPCLFIILSMIEKSSFEPRYLTMCAPLIPVGVCILIGWVRERLRMSCPFRVWLSRGMMVLVFCWSLVFALLTVHPFSEVFSYYAKNGQLPREVSAAPFRMDTYFKKITQSDKASYRELARAVEVAVKEHPEIDIIVVSNFLVFYFLDSAKIPKSVTPVFAIFGRGRLDSILGESTAAGYFHRPPYFSYISLEQPFRGDRLVLYVDYIPEETYPLKWKVAGHDLAIFGGSFIDVKEVGQWRERKLSVPQRGNSL